MTLRYDALVIAGTPGSGASSTAELVKEHLEDDYGIFWAIGEFGEVWRSKHREEAPEKPFDAWWSEEVTAEDNIEADRAMRDRVVEGDYQIIDCRYVQPYRELDDLDSVMDCEDVLLVFIDADVGAKAERVADRGDYEDMTRDEIVAKLEKREKDEIKEGKTNYGIDYTEASLYDLPIDNTDMTLEETAQKIVEELVAE